MFNAFHDCFTNKEHKEIRGKSVKVKYSNVFLHISVSIDQDVNDTRIHRHRDRDTQRHTERHRETHRDTQRHT